MLRSKKHRFETTTTTDSNEISNSTNEHEKNKIESLKRLYSIIDFKIGKENILKECKREKEIVSLKKLKQK
jgi:hypothetical protein